MPRLPRKDRLTPEQRAMVNEKLGLGEPLKPEDFTEDGRHVLPRSQRRKKPPDKDD